MTYVVKWTKAAKQDIREIRQHIEKTSNWYGKVVADAIIASAEDIGINPYRYSMCREYMNNEIRHKVVYDRRIIYEIRNKLVVILTVIHEHRAPGIVIQRVTGDA